MAKCQVFSFRDELKEVVPGGLFMQSLVGETMSIGVVKYVAAGASGIATKAHAHGEEASFQILGGCEIYQGETGVPPLNRLDMAPGTVMVIPAEEPHYGINTYGPDGVSLRLNVASPPRAEYGSKEKPAVYTHQAKDTVR
jgi:hypothetical protein